MAHPKKRRVDLMPSAQSSLVNLAPVLYEEHLLPYLNIWEAARLCCTCKTLQVVVMERVRDVGQVPLRYLPQAMRFCPRAKSAMVHVRDEEVQDTHRTVITDCLIQHGKSLERLGFFIDKRGTTNKTKLLSLAVVAARQGDGLPHLRSLTLPMLLSEPPSGRPDSTSAAGPGSLEDTLQNIEELTLTERAGSSVVHNLLEAVGQAPHLRNLTLQGLCQRSQQRDIPNFIPPSLRELSFDAPTLTQGNELVHVTEAVVKSLQISHAPLENLLMPRPRSDTEPGANGMVAGEETLVLLVKLLAPSIQSLRLFLPEGRSTLATELCVCEKLTSLETSASLFEGNKDITPFFCLTKLVVRSCNLVNRGLWKCMRDKSFPVLESLTLHLNVDIFSLAGEKAVELIKARLSPALRAMRQTLRVLVIKAENSSFPPQMVLVPEIFQGMGEAIAKLHNLQSLSLRGLYSKGFQAYDALAQGLGPSGCPHLNHLTLQGRARNYSNLSSMRSLYSRPRSSPLTLTILDSIHWGQQGVEELTDLAIELLAEGFMDQKVKRVELAEDPDDKGRSTECLREKNQCIQTLRELLGNKFALVL